MIKPTLIPTDAKSPDPKSKIENPNPIGSLSEVKQRL